MIDRAVEAALAGVATAMRDARDPWWIVGSAAVALHGAATSVADIDVLVSERDGRSLIAALDVQPLTPDPHPRFRSALFARWRRADRDVEIMGGFALFDGAVWQTLTPATRVAIDGVFVPDRAELIAILRRFGRLKDLARIALLAR